MASCTRHYYEDMEASNRPHGKSRRCASLLCRHSSLGSLRFLLFFYPACGQSLVHANLFSLQSKKAIWFSPSDRMSFVNVPADSHFPIQNLPYGIFSTQDNVSLNALRLLGFPLETNLSQIAVWTEVNFCLAL